MPRTVPVSATKNAGDLITGALWNAGPAASNTFLTTVPLAVAYQTASQNITNGTWTMIALDSTLVDTDSQHSNSVNNTRFTCQVAGWYSVSGAVSFNTNATGARGAAIFKNGSALTITSGGLTAASNVIHIAPISEVLVPLNIGDYVELAGWQSSGGTITTANGTQYDSCLYARWDHS